MRPAGAQGLDVFQLHAERLLVEKDYGVEGLILGAGGNTFPGERGEKSFQFLFRWQMRRKLFDEVAISPEPGAVTVLRGQRKMLPPNDFRKPRHRFFGIHSTILIYEPPVVYYLFGD